MIKFSHFLSKGDYVFLPSKSNCKVILNITNKRRSANAFKLYNPFSLKARYFKIIFSNLTFVFNQPIKFLFGERYLQSSDFITELQAYFNKEIYSSVYIATAKDKVVLQLQTKENDILSYLKFSLNALGNTHIKNEIEAIKTLVKDQVVDADYLIHSGTYNDFNYCIVKNLDGKIDKVSELVVKNILQALHRKTQYKLAEHPRVLSIREQLETQNLQDLKSVLNNVVSTSPYSYKLVYEHGDFAEWNIAKIGNDYRLFDFEYFVEDGLEYLDLLKFHFQKAFLLNNYKGSQLIEHLKNKIGLPLQFNELFVIFLIKEIALKTKEGQSSANEQEILNSII